MAPIAWRPMLFWVFSASFTPGRWSAVHPLCSTRDKRKPQEETGGKAWRASTGQREFFLDQAEDLSHREWIKCKDYFRVNSDTFDTDELDGSSLYRAMEQHLSSDMDVEGLSTTPTLRPATEARSNNANLRRIRTLPTEDPRRLAAGAGAAEGEGEGVELGQQKERITHSLVYAPDTECDDSWSTWPAVQERAITDGTVFVFDVFSSVGNLFLALEHVMQLVRLLDLGLIITWSKFPGFREAFDPAEINWSVDPAPFTNPSINMEKGTNATGLHSMVFDNYVMVLSDVQLELMALKLGVSKPTTEDLAIHFRETFPMLFHALMTELMGAPFLLNESVKTTPCAWNMLLRRSRSMMASMEEHSPWPAVIDDSGFRTTPPEYIAWHIRTSEGETAQSYNPVTHPYVLQEPASDVCPTYFVAMEDAIQAVQTCGTPSSLDTDGLPVYISSNSKRMAKECTLEAADHDMFMGHVDLGLSEGDAHTGYSRNPQRTAVSAFLDFLYLMDSKAIVRTGSSFSGTVAGIKGLKCHARIYDSLPNRALYFCIPSAC